MATQGSLENYPLQTVLISGIVSIGAYASGAYIILQLGTIWLAAYLAYILLLEARLLWKSCPKCYYYGKVCAFGKGKLSPIFFRKGNPKEFNQRQINWKCLLPDFLIPIIPLLAGIAILLVKFDFLVLAAIVLLVVLAFPCTGFVRGALACKHCRQREIGCPAEKLLKKGKK